MNEKTLLENIDRYFQVNKCKYTTNDRVGEHVFPFMKECIQNLLTMIGEKNSDLLMSSVGKCNELLVESMLNQKCPR